jgi:malonate transporter and related proteins
VNFAQQLLPDFSLIVIGLIICRYTALDRTVWERVEQLVYWLLFPTLLFYSIVRNPLDLKAASGLVVGAVALAGATIALAYALPRVPLLRERLDAREHAASAQIAFRFNSFIALPVAERMAGPEGLQLIAIIIGCCVPIFNVAAVFPMARGSQRGVFGELLRNPLIIATLAGLVCALLGFKMPVWAVPTVERIGAASIALGLMAAGAAMSFGSLWRATPLALSVLTIRHLIAPLIAFALALALKLPPTQAMVLLAFSALPTASSCHVLANRMGYDGALVAAMITASTALALLSLPLALGWLLPMVGS